MSEKTLAELRRSRTALGKQIQKLGRPGTLK